MNEFKSQYWPGELYLDETKSLYAAVGGGEARETPLRPRLCGHHDNRCPVCFTQVRRGWLSTFLNPFARVWANYAAAKDEVPTSNLIGEGTHLGGLLLVRKGSGDVVFGFQEKTFGDYAPPADVLKAAKSL